ncbi:MAG: hypothetical protein DMG39_14840 [Acidobacteria bacterium]|nr:MAG: hypothetical protein DMG39_14840 [Acidobacteriota bacterium]
MPVTAGVFLETQLFVTNNFDFDRRAFAELIDRVKEDRGRVFLTSVTVGEVKRRIQVQVKEAIRFSEVRKYLKVLANSNVPEIRARSERLFPEPVTDELVKQFEDFLEKTKATIIDCSGVNPELVFQQYFELKLPFQEKKDKRHEFPDAFAIEALKDFSRSEGRDIVVITGDQGFRTVCETHGMTVLETVEKFPDKEIAEREPKISAHVLDCFKRSIPEIKHQIDRDFAMSGFELVDNEGEVDGTTLSKLELDHDPLVVRIDRNSAIVEVSVHLEYQAHISYHDPDATHYDKEEGRTYVFNTIHQTVEEEVDFSSEIQIAFDPDDESYCHATIGKLNDGRDFEVTANEEYY